MRVKAALLRTGMAGTAVAASMTFVLLVAPAAPSGAVSETTPTVLNSSCSVSEVVNPGSSVTYEVTCLFAPNATVTVTVGGNAYNTGTANSSGVFTEILAVNGDPQVSLNGGSPIATEYGATTSFVATGPNSSGGTNTATTLVLTTDASTTAAVTGSGSDPSSSSDPLAFTGADLAATVVAGLALLGMGTLTVMYARRRAARSASSVRRG